MNLHNAPLNLGWDPNSFKEVDEAKKIYLKARREGRNVLDSHGNPIERFSPSLGNILIKETELKKDELFLRIFDKTGDRRIIWNAKEPDEIKEAKSLYDEYVKKGWKPYAITRSGAKGYRIYEFDPLKEEIVIDDRTVEDKMKAFSSAIGREKKPEPPKRTVKQKLDTFVKNFKEVKMMPSTYAG